MKFEGHNFADADGLCAAARAALRHGRWRAVGRDVDEPALVFIDRLAIWRCDWHEAIAETWARLLRDDDNNVVEAAIDALAAGAATPAFVPELQAVVGADDAASSAPRDFRADAAPLRLADVIAEATPHHRRLTGRPALIVLRAGRTELARLSDEADFLALARRAAAHGGSLTGGGPGGHFALDWLRTLAIFAAWARPLVLVTLNALLRGDKAAIRAAAEYAVRAGDSAAIAACFRAAVNADATLAATALTVPLAPATTLAGLADWLDAEADIERNSAPRMHHAEA